MLLEIKAFLKARPVANLQQIAKALAIDCALAEQMLSRWIKKGCVRNLSEEPGCGTGRCSQCAQGCNAKPEASMLYCWQDR